MGSRKGCTTLLNTISILEALWSRPVAARLTGLPARSSIVAERARLPDACGSDRTGERTRPRATAESMAVATRVGTFAPSFDWHSAGKSSACPVFQGIELALPEASAAMARPSKAKVRSRMNGAKASNKGKVVSEPAHFVVMVDDSILEQKSSRGRGEPSGGVEFKVISRAKLHKNVLYGDEAWAKEQMARAAGVMRARYRPGCSPERPGLMSVATARAVLSAYAVATSDME